MQSRIVSTGRFALAGLVLAVATGAADAAPLSVTIEKPGQNRVPIALVPLAPLTSQDPKLENEFGRVLGGDLDLSGMFRIIPTEAYIQGVPEGDLSPERVNFMSWQTVGAHYVMMGRYDRVGADLMVEVALFDVPGRTMLGGKRFRGPAGDVPRMAHRTADAILEFTTGVLGPFDSRIGFVSNRGGFAKEIHTFTFDGAVSKITNHKTVTMAPSWSPDSGSIVFTSFKGGAPSLNSIDIRSKAEKKLATK